MPDYNFSEIQKKAKEQVDECVKMAATILLKYGKTLKEFCSPIHPAILALYIAHESMGKRWVITNYPEAGLSQLTVRQNGDDEVGRWNVHPFDPRSQIWAAQQCFWENIRLVRGYLDKNGYVAYEKLPIADQLILLLLVRSIGCGCLRMLLKRAFLTKYKSRPILAINDLISKTEISCAVQGDDTVDVRFLWCSTMTLRAKEVGIGDPLEATSLQAPLPRPSYILSKPVDIYSNLKEYSQKAKRQGDRPTGSWWE